MAGFKTIFRTLTTDTGTTDVEGLGRLRWEDEKCYRWVCNPTTNYTPAAGDLVTHQFTDGTTAQNQIYKPATANLGLLAGVVCAALSASTGSSPYTYGWIQVWGECTTGGGCPAVVTTTCTAGATLKAANGAIYAVLDSAMGTAPIYTRRLLLIDAPATTTTTTVNTFVQCL